MRYMMFSGFASPPACSRTRAPSHGANCVASSRNPSRRSARTENEASRTHV